MHADDGIGVDAAERRLRSHRTRARLELRSDAPRADAKGEAGRQRARALPARSLTPGLRPPVYSLKSARWAVGPLGVADLVRGDGRKRGHGAGIGRWDWGD